MSTRHNMKALPTVFPRQRRSKSNLAAVNSIIKVESNPKNNSAENSEKDKEEMMDEKVHTKKQTKQDSVESYIDVEAYDENLTK